MARDTMVVNVTRGRYGFTVSDASREWELAFFDSPGQGGAVAFVVVLAMCDGVCFSTQRIAMEESQLVQKVVNAVAWMCRSWQEMPREAIKQVVRRQLQKQLQK
jgi:hypothetical protein